MPGKGQLMAKPQLHLVVNAETGEVAPESFQLDELNKKYLGALGELGKLKKELRELRAVEPQSEIVREILDYWRERCRPRATIAPGGKRWEKVRARLKDELDD